MTGEQPFHRPSLTANKFFNGAFPITQKELDNYFILEDGIVKVRHTSVNLESYSRLGKRIYTVNKK